MIKNKTLYLLCLLFLPLSARKEQLPLQASFLSQHYEVRQGRTLRVQVKINQPSSDVRAKFLSKVYRCYPDPKGALQYECYIPIECEGTTGVHPLLVRIKNKRRKKQIIKTDVKIVKVMFPKQKGLRVTSSQLTKKLEKEKKACKKKSIEEDVGRLYRRSPRERMWTGPFGIPTKLERYTTQFGEIRNSSNWGRYLHKAVDIVGPVKHPVWAAQNGKVIIKDRYLYSGNTVVIDHGLGVFTYYYHLDTFGKITIGDNVKKGMTIGYVGNTGYSAGYHLHWELSVNNMAVDPVEWTTKKFA